MRQPGEKVLRSLPQSPNETDLTPIPSHPKRVLPQGNFLTSKAS